jgi:homoserine dehydrogenase
VIAQSTPPKRSYRAPGPARVALLGCGTVGREVARRLLEGGQRLGVELVKILVRDCARDRGLPAPLFTDRFADILAAEPDLIIEAIGGLEPAGAYVSAALERRIPVVTANKTLIAHRGRHLAEISHRTGAGLAFEASVCAAVPVLACLQHLRGDRVLSIRAVVSGSCNYVLTRMADAHLTLGEALVEATRKGLVEPDPTADISGRDSAEKLCVLAAAAGYPGVSPDQFPCEGIDRLTADDIAAARRSGHVIKLLAELDFTGDSPRLRLGPTLVPKGHPFAAVQGEDNAVLIQSELGGELFLRGKGAGPQPTASAVLGDVVRLLAAGQPGRPARTAKAPESSRRHSVRVSSGAPGPERLFSALQRHGVAPDEVSVSRGTARVVTGRGGADRARSCAGDIAGTHEASVLVMPILEAVVSGPAELAAAEA